MSSFVTTDGPRYARHKNDLPQCNKLERMAKNDLTVADWRQSIKTYLQIRSESEAGSVLRLNLFEGTWIT